MSKYELPNISIDVVPFVLNDDGLNVLLGARLNEPFKGELALPGVLLLGSERLDEAAHRALASKVSVTEDAVKSLTDVGSFDNPGRDPRGATVSITKLAILTADATHTGTLMPLNARVELPFDHANIIDAAMRSLGGRFLTDHDVTRALLGEAFTSKTVEAVATQFVDAGVRIPRSLFSNLHRSIGQLGWVEPVDAPVDAPVRRGRPAQYWGNWK